MAAQTTPLLDLDALSVPASFVKHGGTQHELRHPHALSPIEWNAVTRALDRITALEEQSAQTDLSEADEKAANDERQTLVTALVKRFAPTIEASTLEPEKGSAIVEAFLALWQQSLGLTGAKTNEATAATTTGAPSPRVSRASTRAQRRTAG